MQDSSRAEAEGSGLAATLAASGVDLLYESGKLLGVKLDLQVDAICLFNPVIRLSIQLAGESIHLVSADSHQGGFFYPWLPRGLYQFTYTWPITLPAGDYELCIAWGTVETLRSPDVSLPFSIKGNTTVSQPIAGTWHVASETAARIAAMSWQKGMTNWFHRHFCHAATVIGDMFLARTPLLRGRILDIGAGEGITDLGLFLRYQPKELVAMDIVDYLQHLPEVSRENGLPLQALPDGFTFVQGSCENIPFPEASFDIVISWGSVEHIAGGYRSTLDEVWRVLKPGGLFFINPGLFYSSYGSHLGEFSSEPHLHLKISEEKLHDLVMHTLPDKIDRSGFDVTNADYWRFYKELNKIRVAEFEAEIKGYGYTIVRAAIRANDLVEFTPELQPYSIIDLGIEDVFFTVRKPD